MCHFRVGWLIEQVPLSPDINVSLPWSYRGLCYYLIHCWVFNDLLYCWRYFDFSSTTEVLLWSILQVGRSHDLDFRWNSRRGFDSACSPPLPPKVSSVSPISNTSWRWGDLVAKIFVELRSNHFGLGDSCLDNPKGLLMGSTSLFCHYCSGKACRVSNWFFAKTKVWWAVFDSLFCAFIYYCRVVFPKSFDVPPSTYKKEGGSRGNHFYPFLLLCSLGKFSPSLPILNIWRRHTLAISFYPLFFSQFPHTSKYV